MAKVEGDTAVIGIPPLDSSHPSYMAGYAKLGTSTCRQCKRKIEKRELRLAKLVHNWHSGGNGVIYHYFHPRCLTLNLLKCRFSTRVIQTAEEIGGLGDITAVDRDSVFQLVDEFRNKRAAKQPPKCNSKPNSRNDQATVTSTTPDVSPRVKPVSLLASHLNVLYTNADVLTSEKKAELKILSHNEQPHIIAITEVNPKTSSTRSVQDHALPGYTTYSSNVAIVGKRGIIIYIHSSLDKSVSTVDVVTVFEEMLFLSLKLRGGDSLLFGCMYRSPTVSETSHTNNFNLNLLLKQLCKPTENPYSHICIVGDFNYPKISWEQWYTAVEDSDEDMFLSTLQDCFLFQHVTEATRVRGTATPNLLDLVLSNEEGMVSEIQHLGSLGRSDHQCLSFKFSCYLEYGHSFRKFRYHMGNYEAACGFMAERPLTLKVTASVDDIWEVIQKCIGEVRDMFVPKGTVGGKPRWSDKGDFPADMELRSLIREKARMQQLWKQHITSLQAAEYRVEYNRARNKVRKRTRAAKRGYEERLAAEVKDNPKVFFKYCQQQLKTRPGVSPLLADPKDLLSLRHDDEAKAEVLQGQFTSVFTREPDGDISRLPKQTEAEISCISITPAQVLKKLKSLKVVKSAGPDEIHPRILRELADHLATPMASLFQKSLDEGVLPHGWKEAVVSPIFKKGNRKLAENYRPVSLTSVVCKLMETMVREAVLEHLRRHDLLSKKQFGFINGRSTTLQLLVYLDKCREVLSRGGTVDSVYLDFAKAFDTVPHRRLLGKLEAYGIRGSLLKWVKSFLCGRTQQVAVNGAFSSTQPVLSGIPQGSVLGPLLFVVYINDLPNNLSSSVLMFADDTKPFREMKSEEDFRVLQCDLDLLEEWSNKWLLSFHPNKCKVLTIGKHENILRGFPYKLLGEELEHVFEEKDLGVIIDGELSFDSHIMDKVAKANQMLGLIRRTFTFMSAAMMLVLYKCFVRHHIEFSQVLWSPRSIRQVRMLEKVQIRATELIPEVANLAYEDRLRHLKLPTLSYRRARGQMIEVWKHFHVYDTDVLPPSFQRAHSSRRHDFLLKQHRGADGLRGTHTNSFYLSAPIAWNALPRCVVESDNIDTFKNRLDNHWSDLGIRYNYLAAPPNASVAYSEPSEEAQAW
jgi:hypothetical protein